MFEVFDKELLKNDDKDDKDDAGPGPQKSLSVLNEAHIGNGHCIALARSTQTPTPSKLIYLS